MPITKFSDFLKLRLNFHRSLQCPLDVWCKFEIHIPTDLNSVKLITWKGQLVSPRCCETSSNISIFQKMRFRSAAPPPEKSIAEQRAREFALCFRANTRRAPKAGGRKKKSELEHGNWLINKYSCWFPSSLGDGKSMQLERLLAGLGAHQIFTPSLLSRRVQCFKH